MTSRAFRVTCTSALLFVASLAAHRDSQATPWIAPGDSRLRHDIQVLADAGVISSPVTTWPLSWPDVAREVVDIAPATKLAPGAARAFERVLAQARRAGRSSGWTLRASGAHEPTQLRTFAATPREDAELAVGAAWLGERFALRLEATGVANPQDDQRVRMDGSYAAFMVANLAVSAGAVDRWWGPGWDGGLILTSNARPMPGVSIERVHADAFRWRPLRWLGPWRFSVVMGEAERSDVAVPRTRLLGARVNVRPAAWLELGFTRTAQWCGSGRPCDLETFGNLLLGRDNRSDSLGVDEEPGNQMAGYDFRLRSPWSPIRAALYGQLVGEDEAGGLPSVFLGLAGVEHWGDTRLGTHRAHVEVADTTCNFSRERPRFDCAYRNGLYPQGYAFRGRSLGHAMDGDGRMLSAGFLLVRPRGDTLRLLIRRTELNRGGIVGLPHALSSGPVDIDNLELQYNHTLGRGELMVGAGYDHASGSQVDSPRGRGFIGWRQGF